MNSSNRLLQAGQVFYGRAVSALMRGAVSLIAHSGPLQPAMRLLGYRLYVLFVPRAFNETLANPQSVGGLQLYHDGHSDLARMIATGTFEPHVTRLLSTLVRPGMVVLDVGANIGYYTLQAARLCGETGVVWAFEPAPQVLGLLRKSVTANGYDDRIHIVPEAVSNRRGSARLFINQAEQLFSSLYEQASQHHAAEVNAAYVTVTCTTLDTWAAAHDWPPVDLVKIDIEGSETAVLEGMVELSRKSPRLKLIIEFNLRTLHDAGASVDQFFSALDACGLNRISVIGNRQHPLAMPADLPWLLRHVDRHGADYVNLLCEKTVTV